MPGMHLTSNYERFSMTDVGKFERRLIKWTKEVCMHERSVILFDRQNLRVGEPVAVEGSESIYRVVLQTITLEYINIYKDMCIMKKIYESKTERVLYTMPNKWDGSEPWHAF